MRHTRSQTGQRRSHHALTAVSLTLCEKCGSPMQRHRACINCGTYNKRQVLDVMKKLEKKTDSKTNAKAAKAKSPQAAPAKS